MTFLLMAGLLVGCGGGGAPTDPGGNGNAPSFTLSLTGGTLTITQGANGTVTVTITRAGGFSGAVAVGVEGLPQGVTANALSIASGSSSGVLQLTAASGATTGNAQLTIRGTGPGVEPATATLTLTVNASTPAPTPDFTLALTPTSGTAAQGATTQTTATITRTGGFTGAVTFSASGLPTGVTVAFNPAAPTGATSVATFTVGGAVTPGTYPVTIQGVGTGVGNRTASFSLTVTAAPAPSGGNTTWNFCSVSGLPGWVAVQNGSGAWTRVTGTGGVYSFQIDATGGVAWVHDGNGGQTLEVFFGTQAEIAEVGGSRCPLGIGSGKTVNVTFAGMVAGDVVVTTLGGAQPTTTPSSSSTTASYSNVPTGTVDLLGGRSAFDFGAFAIVPQRYLVRRGLTPANGSTIAGADFGGTDGFAPVANAINITGGGGTIATTVSLRTAGGSFGALSGGIGGANWYGVPAGRLLAGDLHLISVSSAGAGSLPPSQTTLRMIATPAAVTMPIGPALTAPTVQAIAATGYSRARAEYPIQAQYNRHWVANFQQAGPFRSSTVQVTQAYRGSGAGTATLEIPNFTGVAGWDASWGLQTGNQVTWTVSAIGWDSPGGVMGPTWADGNTYVTASHMGQFTP